MTDAPPNHPLPRCPARDPLGHKGTFGTVAVVGGCGAGSVRMVGAPVLSARAALRAGCGLVRLVMPRRVLTAGLTMLPSATGLALPTRRDGTLIPHEAAVVLDSALGACDALAVGPGLGPDPDASAGVQALCLRAVQQTDIPVVVDADALNALSAIPELPRDFRAHAVLTPHPGEFRRLAAALRIAADPGDPAQRRQAADQLAQKLGCVVVLKGAGTVVSDGHRAWTSAHADSALAAAGTGDVLTGIIASLIAQHARPGSGGPLELFECAALAVEIHARAAASWRSARGASQGMLAAELADELPRQIDLMHRSS